MFLSLCVDALQKGRQLTIPFRVHNAEIPREWTSERETENLNPPLSFYL